MRKEGASGISNATRRYLPNHDIAKFPHLRPRVGGVRMKSRDADLSALLELSTD